MLKSQMTGILAGWILILLGWNLPAFRATVSDAIQRFRAGFGAPGAQGPSSVVGDVGPARVGFIAAGAVLILVGLVAPLLH